MKKIVLKTLLATWKLAWSNLKLKFKTKVEQLGTHIQIGLTLLFFIMFLINGQRAAQVSENAAKIETITREIIHYRDSTRLVDQASNARIDSMHKQYKRMEEITLRNDKTVAQVQKDVEALKADRKKAMADIDGMTDEQLVKLMRTKKIVKKK